MNKGDHGYVVVCGSDDMYFDTAAEAMRYAAFMAELGYDAVCFDAQIQDDGTRERFRRKTEQEMRACVALEI